MRIKAILLSFFLLRILSGEAQSELSGIVSDTLNKQHLSRSLIMLLRAEDSVLVDFTRTSDSGFFKLTGLHSGNYMLVAAYPAYADFVERVTLQPGQK
ncbi:MAG TPA: carboxypeptidase-like regulatory domain-containing protein, partial [Sediminibacterium sp.]|nr:carboxypeptidase-like regulatory domain-containing protein [Sediminibacterium sp.]